MIIALLISGILMTIVTYQFIKIRDLKKDLHKLIDEYNELSFGKMTAARAISNTVEMMRGEIMESKMSYRVKKRSIDLLNYFANSEYNENLPDITMSYKNSILFEFLTYKIEVFDLILVLSFTDKTISPVSFQYLDALLEHLKSNDLVESVVGEAVINGR